MLRLILSLLSIGACQINHVVLNNGVEMPLISLEPEKYPAENITGLVKLALETGIDSIDAAGHTSCQLSVGAALEGVERNKFFLTAAVLPGANISSSSAFDAVNASLHSTLARLRVSYVDLMLVGQPATSCMAMQEEWRAMEEFYHAGLARAIGLRMSCPASLECIWHTLRVIPAVNQMFYHVGMGPDPLHFISTFKWFGTVSSSIRSLGSGDPELISGKLVSDIGNAHGWSGAQVSMRWILDHGLALFLPLSKQSHMEEAVAILRDTLTQDEMAELDMAKVPQDSPSPFCPSVEALIV